MERHKKISMQRYSGIFILFYAFLWVRPKMKVGLLPIIVLIWKSASWPKHSGPENFVKSTPRKLVKSNKSISRKFF